MRSSHRIQTKHLVWMRFPFEPGDTCFLWSRTGSKRFTRDLWTYDVCRQLGRWPRLWPPANPTSQITPLQVYRPISLLMTISKGVEAIVARRLSCLAEVYHLLPQNHFGGRRRPSCEQALDVVIEKIQEAKRARRVLSLVTFDVQGAFNGVHTKVLCDRLQQRLSPDNLTKWIEDFCSGRQGSIVVGKHCTAQR